MKEIYKYLFVFLGCMFIFPLVSNAQCSYERQAELSRIAANVKFSYTYEVGTEYPKFYITVSNVTDDIYVIDEYNGIDIRGNEERTISSDDITSNFLIYSNDVSCRDELLLTRYVNVPKFNEFSQKKECKENPDFKYCEIWGAVPGSDDEFYKELDKYKEKQLSELEKKENETFNIFSFFKENKNILLTIGISIFVLITSLILIKRRRA